MAADWGLYGSMRFKTFYVTQDSDYSSTGDSDTDLREFGLQTNSRVGAKVKVNDKFTAHLELYVKGASNGNAVGTRLMYGTYDFGGLKLSIGQMWNPLNVLSFDQVSKDDGDLLGWGAFFTGRNEAVMVEVSGLRVALVRNTQSNFDNYDVTTPRIEADYTLKVDPVKARIFAGYQTFSAETDNATTFDTDSYVVGADITGKMSIVGFALSGYYGSNTSAMGASGDNKLKATKDEDTKDFGVAVALNFTPTDNMKIEVGYGYTSSDSDDVSVKEADEQQSYYANLKYTVAKGFFVQPEVAVYDYMKDKDDADQGQEVYFGAKWQMDF